MKKIVLTLIVGISTSVFLSGCGKSPTACDDSDAKELVMQISEQEIKKQLLKRINPFSTYEAYVSEAKKGEGNNEAEQAIDKIDKQYEDADPTLSNIRTEAVDDKLLKTECAANIEYKSGNKSPITYQLSITSKGDLYTEVFGL